MRIASIVSLGAAFLIVSRPSAAQPVDVTFLNGLVTINCRDAELSTVFEQIEAATGIELTLEDEVKSKRLTANLEAVPVGMAVSRLLEGAGVNYIVMMDPSDWERVDKIFVGAGGGGASRGSGGPVRSPMMQDEPPPEEVFEEAAEFEGEDAMDPADMGEAVDPALEGAQEDMLPDEFGAGQDPSELEGGPAGSSPVQEFFPPAQQFPRSSFTPGLPRGNQRNNQSGFSQPSQFGQTGQEQQFGQEQDPANGGGMMPFTDPFGRPIPVPPGTNPQQQQPRRQQQQQQ